MPGPSTQPVSTTRPTARPADRLDVLEAVFRHQIRTWDGGPGGDPDYFFLSLDGLVDPPAELLHRFADEVPPVLPVSFANVAPIGGVQHKDGGRGVLLRALSIAWLDDDTAEVDGGYYLSGRSATGHMYRVEREGGRWRITEDQRRGVS